MDKGKLDRCVRKSIEAKVAAMRTVMSMHAQYVVLDSRCKHRSTAGSHTVISRSASAGQAYDAQLAVHAYDLAHVSGYTIYIGGRGGLKIKLKVAEQRQWDGQGSPPRQWGKKRHGLPTTLPD